MKSHLLENFLELLKALSLHDPGPDEEKDGKSGGVEKVDAPGVEEKDVPQVGETRSTENADKTLERGVFLDEFFATSEIHFLTKTFPPSEKTFLKLSEVRLPLDLGQFSSFLIPINQH